MKKISCLLSLFTLLITTLSAQTPQHLSWQGIARNNAGNPLTVPVEIRFTILQAATPVFSEEKILTPNAFGLLVWNIGDAQPANFAALDWSNGNKSLQIEMRTPPGSGNYTLIGTEEFKSVPYALIADKALSDKDQQTISVSGNTLSISNGNTVDLPSDGDGSSTNEIQSLSIAGQTLSLSNGGGSVTLPADADGQTLTLSGQILSISGGNNVTLPLDGDGSSTNEIQTVALNGQVLSLSNGGGSVTLPPEAQSLTLSGQNLSISGGNTVVLPPESQTLMVNGQNLSISNGNTVLLPQDGDGSSSNEIQHLVLIKDSLQLSNGGGYVTLKDTSATNEIQQLSMVADTLKLSKGGSFVTLKDTSATNEIQQLSLSGSNLTLSKGGGTIPLPGGTNYQAGSGIYFTAGNKINALDVSDVNEIQDLSIAGDQITLSQGGGTISLPDPHWELSGGNIFNTNSGNVGIGVSSPNYKVDVAGEINLNNGGSGIAVYVNNSEAVWYDGYYSWGYGGFSNYFNSFCEIGINVCCWALEVDGEVAKPGGGSWSALSDARYKEKVEPYTDGLASIMQINPVRYHYNERSGYDTQPEYIGVIAQELRPTAPYMVREMPTGQLNGKENAVAAQTGMNSANGGSDAATDTYLSVDNSAMTYMLINAVKEQQKQIQQLTAQVQQLQGQVAQWSEQNKAPTPVGATTENSSNTGKHPK